MTKADMVSLARRKARDHGLSSKIVCAVIETESGWFQYAARFEPGFKRKYIDPIKYGTLRVFGRTSRDTQRQLRSMSIGLMQVMGQVARELGFAGESLLELVHPEVGIEYGCRRLKKAYHRTAARASSKDEHDRLALLTTMVGRTKSTLIGC